MTAHVGLESVQRPVVSKITRWDPKKPAEIDVARNKKATRPTGAPGTCKLLHIAAGVPIEHVGVLVGAGGGIMIDHYVAPR